MLHVMFCTDIWLSSSIPASQSTEENSLVADGTSSLPASDDTYVTTLEQRLMFDIDNRTASLSSSSANFPETNTLSSDAITSVRNDNFNQQSPFMWHVPEDSDCHPDMDSLLQSIAATKAACSNNVGSERQRTQMQMRRVSADDVESGSATGANSSQWSESELYKTPPSAFSSSTATVEVSNISDISNAGQPVPKRRSSDQPDAVRRSSDGMVSAPMPKQRANSVHAVTQSSPGPQGAVVSSSDPSRNSWQHNFPFVVPVAQALQSNAGNRLVIGRTEAAEPSGRQQDVVAKKLCTTGRNGSAVTKHVTFTDQKVNVVVAIISLIVSVAVLIPDTVGWVKGKVDHAP